MRSIVLLMLFTLAGCGSGSPTPAAGGSPSPSASPAPTASASATPATSTLTATPARNLAVLDNRDCRTVAQAYINAIARDDFAFAARVWNDPAIDAPQLSARFSDYAVPQIEITKVQEEGAAGSLYCTVTGMLSDVADPSKPRSEGEIVLRRVDDVPGATAAQLRWTIRSSTFAGKAQRSAKGAPS